ncbi:MAG TPA: WG repeat-containing protein [Candidatus Coprenecus avistercoris]|uniref:WG repeat-containing protein n=1 Tax=Candidatus Coprenecus avistercoris TaxID=2840730 RepID=A0A9D1DZT9_9BACT|nr:WG repeat-containing protein [Candidatus Coprenecus avistercoris]
MKRILTVITACSLAMYTATAQNEDREHGFKWVRTIHEDAVLPLSEGLAAFSENGTWGYMDAFGNKVIQPSFDRAMDFRGGAAPVYKDSKWGVINNSGYVVIPIQYDTITTFSNGTALAVKDGVHYYLYATGQVRQLPERLTFYPYSDGVARVRKASGKGGKFGYIDNDKGYYTIDHKYDNAGDFQYGYAIVSRKGKSFIINHKEGRYKIIGNIPVDGSAISSHTGAGFTLKDNGTYNLITKDGRHFKEVQTGYTSAEPFREELALVSDGGSLKFIHPSGATAISLAEYKAAGSFSSGLAWVRTADGMYGYIDKKGKMVIDPVFSMAGDFSEGYASVIYEGRKGIIKLPAPYDTQPILDISGARISDANSNSTIEPGETFRYTVSLENNGDETAMGVTVSITAAGEQTGQILFDKDQIQIPELYSGDTEDLTFTGRAGTYLAPGEINLEITAGADNLFSSSTISKTVKSGAASRSRMVIASYRVYTPDNTPITQGQPVRLEIYIKNDGTDPARGAAVRLRLPDGVTARTTELSAGNVAPGEAVRVTTLMDIDPATAQTSFSVIASVSEMSKKQSDVKFVTFDLGETSSSANFLLQ